MEIATVLVQPFVLQEIDMSFTPMGTNSQRSRVQDFSKPFHFEYSTVAYKKLDALNRMSLYLEPFSTSVSST